MLKKSLQYLIRCSFLLAFVTCICLSSLLNSCQSKKTEDIFSFLKKNATYSLTVKRNEKIILTCSVTLTYEKDSPQATLAFAEASTLNKAGVTFLCSEDYSYFVIDKDPLQDFTTPPILTEICSLLFPPADAVSVTSNRSACTIEAITSSQKAVTYILSNDGSLSEIRSYDLTLTVDNATCQ